MFVPVIGPNQQPLMPTTPARARKWIQSGRATPFWKGGIFCIRLNVEPSAQEVQPIAVGIDPGSKREGYSVVSAAHTYVNIQAQAREGVKQAEQDSSRMRRTRRHRKTPCRQPRPNRHQSKKKLPPSTRARGPWKLRLAGFLCQLFPVSVFVVEDIKAPTRGKKRWDQSFSPLEVGKQWFYAELGHLAPVQTKQGYQTQALREQSYNNIKRWRPDELSVSDFHGFSPLITVSCGSTCLALGSFFCVLIFAALVLVLHVLRPQLNPLSHAISEYALGPFGSLMTIAFIMRGVGELFLVTGLALGTMRSSRSWTGLVLLALSTVCSFLVAIFPGNLQNTRILLIHSSSALLGFSSLAIAALVWSQRFRKDPLWRSSALASFILGLLMLLSLVSLVESPSGFLGLTERVLEVFIVFWLCFMAWRLSTLASSKPLSPS